MQIFLVSFNSVKVMPEGLEEWIEWASAYDQRLDPLSHPEKLAFKKGQRKWLY